MEKEAVKHIFIQKVTDTSSRMRGNLIVSVLMITLLLFIWR
jgi:hypothetical protein